MKGKKIFDSDSVIDEKTNIDQFIPPYPGWNYVRLLQHPEDRFNYQYNIDTCGKWLVFVPAQEFVEVFRKLCKLAKEFKLTHCFKASGEPGKGDMHVFCIYCSDYHNFSFVRKIGNTLLTEGILDKYGYKYRDGTRALFFKTDNTTHYKSNAFGESLTLFRFTNKRELYIKEFFDNKPGWKIVIDDNQRDLTENFEMHLETLEIGDENFD